MLKAVQGEWGGELGRGLETERKCEISKGKLRESGLPASMKESAEGSRRVG